MLLSKALCDKLFVEWAIQINLHYLDLPYSQINNYTTTVWPYSALRSQITWFYQWPLNS